MRNDLQLSIPSTQLSTEMIAYLLLTYALEAINGAPPIAKIERSEGKENPSGIVELRTVFETKGLKEVINGKKEFMLLQPANSSFVESSAIFNYQDQHAAFAIGDDNKFRLVKIENNGTLTEQTISFKEQEIFDSSSVALELKASETTGNIAKFADISTMQLTTVDDYSFLPTVLRRVAIEKDGSGNLQKVTISFNPMTKLHSNAHYSNAHFFITPGINIEITDHALLSNHDFIALIQDRDSFFKAMGPSIMVYPDTQDQGKVKIAGTIPFITAGQLEFRRFSSSLSDQSWSAVNISNPQCELDLSSDFGIDPLLPTQSFCINRNGTVAVLVPDDDNPNKKNILIINATHKSALTNLTADLSNFIKKFDSDFKYLKTGLAKLLFDATKKCFHEGKDLIDEISKNITSCLKDLTPEVTSAINSAISATLGATTTAGATTTTGTTTTAGVTTTYGNSSNSTNSSLASQPSSYDNQNNVIIGLSCALAIAACCCAIAGISAHYNRQARVAAEERLYQLGHQGDPTGLGRGGGNNV